MSAFDKDLAVGDLITAYHKGFHVVERVERRFHKDENTIPSQFRGKVKVGDEYKSLIHYKTVLTAKYTATKGKAIKCCDAAFCEKLDKAAIKERQQKLVSEINSACNLTNLRVPNPVKSGPDSLAIIPFSRDEYFPQLSFGFAHFNLSPKPTTDRSRINNHAADH
tara:strand:+ start:1427 stop:1921 length:495 start_codon:yes stop_codon:yes gene_type:complete